MKANVLRPALKNPMTTQIRNINPESTKIANRRATSLTCDHPGVVGENDNWKTNQIKYESIVNIVQEFSMKY